jgi:hypothetical protein
MHLSVTPQNREYCFSLGSQASPHGGIRNRAQREDRIHVLVEAVLITQIDLTDARGRFMSASGKRQEERQHTTPLRHLWKTIHEHLCASDGHLRLPPKPADLPKLRSDAVLDVLVA